jgi:signal peptidase II
MDEGTAGPFGRIEIIEGLFALEGTYNPGVTFGLAQGQTELILVFTFVATSVLGAWLFLTRRHSRLLHVALAMVLAGALGNLWDRLHWHKVRDFFLFYLGEPQAAYFEWPNFNVADSMIVVGVGLILLDELILSRWRARRAAVRGTTTAS